MGNKCASCTTLNSIAPLNSTNHNQPAQQQDEENETTIRILLIGLDSAGKTTTAQHIQGEPIDTVVPTVGFNRFQLNFPASQSKYIYNYTTIPSQKSSANQSSTQPVNDNNNGPDAASVSSVLQQQQSPKNQTTSSVVKKFEVEMFDLGGGGKIRGIWPNYYALVHGVIWVLDASDRYRMSEARTALTATLQDDHIRGKPLLLLINKHQLDDSLDEVDVSDMLGLSELVNKSQCPTKIESYCAIYPECQHHVNDFRRQVVKSSSVGSSLSSHSASQSAATQSSSIFGRMFGFGGDQRQSFTRDLGLIRGYHWLVRYVAHNWPQLSHRVREDTALQVAAERARLNDAAQRIKLRKALERRASTKAQLLESIVGTTQPTQSNHMTAGGVLSTYQAAAGPLAGTLLSNGSITSGTGPQNASSTQVSVRKSSLPEQQLGPVRRIKSKASFRRVRSKSVSMDSTTNLFNYNFNGSSTSSELDEMTNQTNPNARQKRSRSFLSGTRGHKLRLSRRLKKMSDPFVPINVLVKSLSDESIDKSKYKDDKQNGGLMVSHNPRRRSSIASITEAAKQKTDGSAEVGPTTGSSSLPSSAIQRFRSFSLRPYHSVTILDRQRMLDQIPEIMSTSSGDESADEATSSSPLKRAQIKLHDPSQGAPSRPTSRPLTAHSPAEGNLAPSRPVSPIHLSPNYTPLPSPVKLRRQNQTATQSPVLPANKDAPVASAPPTGSDKRNSRGQVLEHGTTVDIDELSDLTHDQDVEEEDNAEELERVMIDRVAEDIDMIQSLVSGGSSGGSWKKLKIKSPQQNISKTAASNQNPPTHQNGEDLTPEPPKETPQHNGPIAVAVDSQLVGLGDQIQKVMMLEMENGGGHRRASDMGPDGGRGLLSSPPSRSQSCLPEVNCTPLEGDVISK